MSTGTLKIPPPTFEDPFVEPDSGRLSSEAFNWIVINLLPRIAQTANVYGTTPPYSVGGLNDAVAPTPLPLGTLSTGLYRVMTYLRITSPDGVSSSVTPQLSFVDDGVTCTMTGFPMTSDAIDEPDSQAFLVAVDQPGPISFSTLYASNTPNAAAYKAIVVVERVQ
jgi:hypothetical protein